MSHSIYDMTFRRKFSVNPYKTLRMKLGEMSFSKDWLNTSRGDPYPVIASAGEGTLTETTGDGYLTVRNFSRKPAAEARLLGQHFPYASYELVIRTLDNADAGFLIRANPGTRSSYTAENAPELRISLIRSGTNTVRIAYELTVGGVSRGEVVGETEYPCASGMSLILTCRGKFFDVYLRNDKRPYPRLTLDLPEFAEITKHGTFVNAVAALWYRTAPGGCFTADEVEFYLDGGVSHADMKTVRYEDGTPMMSEGKLFMTMSSRLEAGGFQSVISWNPSTAEFKLEGAIFFDCGDDRWCSDVASSILYNRNTGEWYIWACAFSHGHILCHGTSAADLRYGINVIDAELMPVETLETSDAASADSLAAQAGAQKHTTATLSDDTLWLAKTGDEDPDFVYDRETGKWYMTICRGVSENGGTHYRYFLFESDQPFGGYTFVDKTLTGSNTGGSIVRVCGKLHFVCGSNFDKRACYHVYDLDDLSKVEYIRCDYDDGGFRGWGTIIPVPCGRRTKYLWMTFDRHGGSSYNWSYGNIYVYEADLMNNERTKG